MKGEEEYGGRRYEKSPFSLSTLHYTPLKIILY